jgi:hypothetical protein
VSGSGGPGRSPLLAQVLDLVGALGRAYSGTAQAATVADIEARLHDPLRVAIAGKVKAGKSTLLNALAGDELAPTDAGECTRVVTWYRHGVTYRVTMLPRSGPSRQVPFARDEGAIDVDLGGLAPEEVESLQVEWPVPALERMTLIDTPGIGSLTVDASARSLAFLAPDDERTTPSDAVLYLVRHLHASDLAFLDAFHEEEYAQPSPVNCIGVLSRADEVAAGRLDAMASAARIAERYSADPRLRRLVQRVVPVAGLLAQAGTSLREAEFRDLRAIAGSAEADDLLLSADRFVGGVGGFDVDAPQRRLLLDRLGMFGVRLSVDLLRRGEVGTAAGLADRLVAESGIGELRELLLSRFSERRDTLKARSALLGVARLVALAPPAEAARIEAQLEQVWAGAHEFVELRLLNALRRGEVDVRPEEEAEIERLLGGAGPNAASRLGLDPDASVEEVRAALLATVARWRQRGEGPLSSRAASEAALAVVRTCEGLYARLS